MRQLCSAGVLAREWLKAVRPLRPTPSRPLSPTRCLINQALVGVETQHTGDGMMLHEHFPLPYCMAIWATVAQLVLPPRASRLSISPIIGSLPCLAARTVHKPGV
jgi:hypothetical protein